MDDGTARSFATRPEAAANSDFSFRTVACIDNGMKAVFYRVNPVGWATCKWLRYLWKGCLTSGLNGFSLRNVPVPELPGRRWVRVRTLLGGICGSDLALAAQKSPANSLLQAYSSMPMILGHENVAVVEEVGPEVDRSWIGRRVIVEPTLCCAPRGTEPPCDRCAAGEFGACENFSGDLGGSSNLPPGVSIGYNARTGGSWGEHFVAHISQLVPVADSVSDEDALLVDPLGCSLHGVLKTDLNDVKRVLVYGAGTLGLGVIASLRALGFDGRIEVLGRVEHFAATAARLGADEYFTLPKDNCSRFGQIAGRTGATIQRARFGNYMISGGYDRIFDCVGSQQSVTECMKWTRARGEVIILGTLQSGHLDLTPLWFRELRIVGAYGRQKEHFQGRRIGTYQLVLELLEAGKLCASSFLTHRFRLDEYRRALWVAMHKSEFSSIKVAFDFR